MSTKPKTMEERILAALQGGPKSNRDLREALGLDPETYDSQMDRTLQTLRKQGGIRLVNRRWALATVKTCTKCQGRGWVGKGALCEGCQGYGWINKPKSKKADAATAEE